jgi:hypothetical protein
MNAKCTDSRIPARIVGLSLSLFVVMLLGCTTSRNYPGPVHGLTFNGYIKAVDLHQRRLTVQPLKSSDPVVFLWDEDTRFWKKGVPIKADVLEISWPVRIHYHTSSVEYRAHHVYVDLAYPAVH